MTFGTRILWIKGISSPFHHFSIFFFTFSFYNPYEKDDIALTSSFTTD